MTREGSGQAGGERRPPGQEQLDEATLRELVQQLPLTIYIDHRDAASSNVYTSPMLESVLGYTVEEWRSDEELFLKVVHPDDRERVLAETRRTDETGELSRMEYRMIARDGRVRWFLDQAVRVGGSAGERGYNYGFLLDITEQKELEEELHRQKQYFESLVEISPVAIVTTDLEERVTSWNPTAERLFGFTRAEAVGEVIDELLLRTEELHQVSVTRQALEEGRAHLVTRRMRKDGAFVDVEVVMAPLAVDGEHTGFYVIYHDISAFKQAADAQRKAEERFRRLVEELPLVTYIDEPDVNSTGIYIGPQVEALLGTPAEEWIGNSEIFPALLHPDDRERALAEQARILSENLPRWSYEYRLIARDGRTVWIRDDGVVVKGDDGTPLYVQGFMIDITERKLAEERYRQLVEELPLVTYIDEPNAQSTNIYTSPQVEALLGIPPAEWVGNDELWEALLHPDDRERALAVWEEFLAAGESRWSNEYRLMARDGRAVWLRDAGVVVKDEHGTPLYVLGFWVDITEQKHAEEALRRTEEEARRQKQYYQSLVELSPTAVITADLEDRVTSWNPAAERLFGYTEPEALGRTIAELLLRTHSLHEDGAAVAQHAREEGLADVVTRRMRKDGSLVDVEVLMAPVVVDGEQTGYLLVYHDVSDLMRARQEAEAANQAKSSFLATMSHEIRTPMNAVIGMTGLLLDTDLNPEQRGFAEIIRTSGDSLLRIIDDILDFSKIEAGKLEFESHPFDLRECIEGALDVVATRMSQKAIDLAYVLEPEVPAAIVGDVTRLRQILINLLNNAVKFTEEGEVVLSVAAEGLVSGGDGRKATHKLAFSVRDTGIGIPAERMNSLFESFSQVDTSMTRRYGGTGLGLAISKRLAELMGGTLWAESEVGKGSTFQFTMLAEEAAGPIRSYPEGAQPQLEGKRILIVDDNATNREILTRQAESWGMLPQAAELPSEALVWIRRGDPFDLAVLDLAMPGMDGLTLAREIRRHRDSATLPLVLLTSLGRLREMRTATEFAACLTKPVKASQLYEALVAVLMERAPRTPEVAAPAGVGGGDDQPVETGALRVLLAEDNAVNQQLALALLRKIGYRADVVANGLEALAALEREPYDVVLMDVQMPELDGLETTRRVHERWPVERRPRIIAMTANAMQGDREECLAAGMDDYVAKPIDIEELAGALGRCRPLGGLPDASPPAPEVVPESSSGPLDPAALERLGAMVGDGAPEFLAELIDTFLDDAPRQLDGLRGAVARGDAAEARRAAHTLKSTAATFGAQDLSDVCRELENLANAGALDRAALLIPRAEEELDRAKGALEAVREGSQL